MMALLQLPVPVADKMAEIYIDGEGEKTMPGFLLPRSGVRNVRPIYLCFISIAR